MKKCILLLTFMMLALTTVRSQEQEEDSDKVKTGDSMPAFTIVSDNGQQLPSSEFSGNVLLITMFATWCPSCQLENGRNRAIALAEIQRRQRLYAFGYRS